MRKHSILLNRQMNIYSKIVEFHFQRFLSTEEIVRAKTRKSTKIADAFAAFGIWVDNYRHSNE